MQLKTVDLPAPLGPISACMAPLSKVIEKLSSAKRPPKRIERFFISKVTSKNGLRVSHWHGTQAEPRRAAGCRAAATRSSLALVRCVLAIFPGPPFTGVTEISEIIRCDSIQYTE